MGRPEGTARRRLRLPAYPFSADRHWMAVPDVAGQLCAPDPVVPAMPVARVAAAAEIAMPAFVPLHPLLDQNLSSFDRVMFAKRFTPNDPLLRDHQVGGVPVLPGAATLEMARRAGELASGRPVTSLQQVLWQQPLVVADQAEQALHIGLYPEVSGQLAFEIYSQAAGGEARVHSHGQLVPATAAIAAAQDLDAIRAACGEHIDAEALYALFDKAGLHYGASHRAIRELWVGEGLALARLVLPAGTGFQWGIAGDVVRSGDTLVAADIEGRLLGFDLPR